MKKRKILSIIIAVIIALNCFSVFAIATTRTTQYHGISGITRVKQAKSNWCWAACSEMVGKHYNSASGQNQYSIVYHFNNNYDNVTATGAQTAAAASYASGGTHTFTYMSSTLQFSRIVARMQSNQPVIAGLTNWAGYGHLVVIYGTQFVDNASGLKHYVDIIDPLTGGSRHLEFSSFCSGALYNLYYFETIV